MSTVIFSALTFQLSTCLPFSVSTLSSTVFSQPAPSYSFTDITSVTIIGQVSAVISCVNTSISITGLVSKGICCSIAGLISTVIICTNISCVSIAVISQQISTPSHFQTLGPPSFLHVNHLLPDTLSLTAVSDTARSISNTRKVWCHHSTVARTCTVPQHFRHQRNVRTG
ncbi:hypothetical protein BDD12DRAFT_129636 [Trichophaea hybrida]|nr:hypothetical protein BDD12DRAFT_129636 [Trichophaea hybrida]